jgi:hypothetical protein
MKKLLEELDGAYLVRYINNIVFAWHGGVFINAFDEEGNSLDTMALTTSPKALDALTVEDELVLHLTEMGMFDGNKDVA